MTADAPPDAWIAPLRGLLRERLGHEVPEARARGELAAFAIARARAVGADGPAAWLDLVGGPHGGEEWRRLVRAATVGETYFFRHPEQLRAAVAPARAAARRGRPLAVWSAGCATGEEAYSLAILLAEAGVAAEVLGTDVNDEALARARAAAGYSDRSAGHMPADLRARWLAPDGGRWRIPRAAELRVSFAPHNVARDAAPAPRPRTAGSTSSSAATSSSTSRRPSSGDVVARLLSAVAPGRRAVARARRPRAGRPPAPPPRRRRTASGSSVRPAGPAVARPGAGARAAARPRRAAAGAGPLAAPEPDVAADLLEQGLVATAEEALERRVAQSPGDAEAFVALAAIALSRHDFPRRSRASTARGRASPPPPGFAYVRGLALSRTEPHGGGRRGVPRRARGRPRRLGGVGAPRAPLPPGRPAPRRR